MRVVKAVRSFLQGASRKALCRIDLLLYPFVRILADAARGMAILIFLPTLLAFESGLPARVRQYADRAPAPRASSKCRSSRCALVLPLHPLRLRGKFIFPDANPFPISGPPANCAHHSVCGLIEEITDVLS